MNREYLASIEKSQIGSGGISFFDIVPKLVVDLEFDRLEPRELRDLCSMIVRQWVDSKLERLNDLAKGSRVVDYPIEFTTLGKSKVTILGVRHGLMSGSELDRGYVKFIKDKVICDPDIIWFTEEGLANQFELSEMSNVREIDDIKVAVRKMNPDDKGLAIVRTIKILHNAYKSMTSLSSTRDWYPEDVREISDALWKKSRLNPELISNVLAFLKTAKLPEPLDMELAMYMSNPRLEPDLCIDRSKYQAEFVRSAAISSPGKYGVIVGYEHVSHIKYFLENPDYDARESIRKIISRISR